ncbi:MAG: cobalamin 5'-phosphate synthase [Epulopiscium sp. Nuni2H_MBin003]|nr:MAG: cobalamin 5'-phosphate synthase [Epulopiscium sp. Nuni2H_MBin003]
MKSLIISFSMYSIIPMPHFEWTKDNMKYSLALLPIVGIIIGVIWHFMYIVLQSFTHVFSSTMLLLIPIIISGGIHLDGLIDTSDAIFSYGDTQKKLEILKDPRTGAFGVIGAVVYFLCLFSIYYEMLQVGKFIEFMPFTFMISRSIGALCLLSVPKAKTTGLGATFSNSSDITISKIILACFVVFGFIKYIGFNVTICILIMSILSIFLISFIFYIKKCFGGINGDLTGFIITTVEMLVPLTIVIGGKFL